MHDKQLIEKLVYDIASRFDTSINLAEAQAVVGASPAEDLEWLCDCFEEIGLDHEKIENLKQINFERFTGVGLIWGPSKLIVFGRNDNQEDIVFLDYLAGNQISWKEAQETLALAADDQIMRFYERQHEAYAVIPGIESHWFFFADLEKSPIFISISPRGFAHQFICPRNIDVLDGGVQQNYSRQCTLVLRGFGNWHVYFNCGRLCREGRPLKIHGGCRH
jgi:hypothetical protein